MEITAIDHIVLTVIDPERTVAFYTQVLGLDSATFNGNRRALVFGSQKINLHKAGEEIAPHAKNPAPGSADLCFITEVPMQQVMSHLHDCTVAIVAGPVPRTGASGGLLSIYIRDPDGNLIEIANRLTGKPSDRK